MSWVSWVSEGFVLFHCSDLPFRTPFLRVDDPGRILRRLVLCSEACRSGISYRLDASRNQLRFAPDYKLARNSSKLRCSPQSKGFSSMVGDRQEGLGNFLNK